MKSASFSPSNTSRSMKQMIQSSMSLGPRPEDLPSKELMADVDELALENHTLFLENEIFERYLSRMEPELIENLEEDMNTMINRESRARKVASILMNKPTLKASSSSSFGKSVHSYEPVVTFDLMAPERKSMNTAIHSPSAMLSTVGSYFDREIPKLNTYHKIEMASREMEELKRDMAKFKKQSDVTKAIKRARIAEIQLTKLEVKKTRADFVSKIVVNGVEKLTGRIPAERFVRFMEKWLNSADFDAGKLRLQATTLRAINTRFITLLKEKIERGDALKPIDFERLKLAKAENQKRLDKLNYTCHKLNIHMSRSIYQVGQYRKEFFEKDRELQNLNNEIENKNNYMNKLMIQAEKVKTEIIVARDQLEDIKDKRRRYSVPDVLSYVKLKAEIYTLEKKLKSWKRKIYVQHQCLKSNEAKLRKMGSKETMPEYFEDTQTQEVGVEEEEIEETSAGYRSWEDLYGLKSKMSFASRDKLEEDNGSVHSEENAVEEKCDEEKENPELVELFCNRSFYSLRKASSINMMDTNMMTSLSKEEANTNIEEGIVTSLSKEMVSMETKEGMLTLPTLSKEMVGAETDIGMETSISKELVGMEIEEGIATSLSKEMVSMEAKEGVITSLLKVMESSDIEEGIVKSMSKEMGSTEMEKVKDTSMTKEIDGTETDEGVVKSFSKENVSMETQEGIVTSTSKEMVGTETKEGIETSKSKEIVSMETKEGIDTSMSKDVVYSKSKEGVVTSMSKEVVGTETKEGVVASMSKEVVGTETKEGAVASMSKEVVGTETKEGKETSMSKEVVSMETKEGVVTSMSKEVVCTETKEGIETSMSKEIVGSETKAGVVTPMSKEGIKTSMSKEVVGTETKEGKETSMSKEVVGTESKAGVVTSMSHQMVSTEMEEAKVTSLSKEMVKSE